MHAAAIGMNALSSRTNSRIILLGCEQKVPETNGTRQCMFTLLAVGDRGINVLNYY